MSRRAQDRWKPLFEAVRDVLNLEWDPIGVFPQVQDEYDSYALRIARLLLDGADAYKIAERLTEFERVSMGFDQAAPERNRAIAEKLVRLSAES